MSTAIIKPTLQPLQGVLTLPGDKSISHRRALLSILTSEHCTLENFGTGADCATTLNCLETLGKYVKRSENRIEISGNIAVSKADLNCGNSGTTTRLLMGILAVQPGTWFLHGDESLSKRPMERVAAPLRLMGADIQLTNGFLPATIHGKKLSGIRYDSPVVSAQVKSAILLAGLRANGRTCYRERARTRDHTERLLQLAPDHDGWITVQGRDSVSPSLELSGRIPGDPSTAAFWMVAALAIPGSRITFPDVLLNSHRTAFIDLLKDCGAKPSFQEKKITNGELHGRLSIEMAALQPLHITSASAAAVIDEIPALAILATQCKGRSEFNGVSELRVKESDRLKLITHNLIAMGAQVSTWEDGFSVEGPCKLNGTVVDPEHDHRIAMAFAIAGLLASGETQILHAECAAVSYPEFWSELMRLAPDRISLVE